MDEPIGNNAIRGIAGLSYITVTDNEVPHPTGDVVHIHTIDDVRINTSQVKGIGREPDEG